MRHVLAPVLAGLMLAGSLTDTASADEVQLRAIGSHGASYIYTTYGYIGVLADAYVKDVYSAEKVEELMSEVNGILRANKANLEAVKAAGLSEADQASVSEMIEIYGLLETQANALVKFSKTKDRDAAKEFEGARKTVWPKIAKLLGISADPAAAASN